jgi:altronate hydrolase
VAKGATTVLAETPEVFSTEHLLAPNNPSPGNKAGGLTPIPEKSLGAVAKGGTAELVAVHEYAERVTATGPTFMDTPGFDPISVTGLVAGGAIVVCFTTGHGSVLGTKPVPSIKIAANTAMLERLRDDMDLDAGGIAEGHTTIDAIGKLIFETVLETASGRSTVSEDLDLGRDEFVPWQLGAVT